MHRCRLLHGPGLQLAEVNARANGGATPLMMAEVMGRTEIAANLRKAGAAPWK